MFQSGQRDSIKTSQSNDAISEPRLQLEEMIINMSLIFSSYFILSDVGDNSHFLSFYNNVMRFSSFLCRENASLREMVGLYHSGNPEFIQCVSVHFRSKGFTQEHEMRCAVKMQQHLCYH